MELLSKIKLILTVILALVSTISASAILKPYRGPTTDDGLALIKEFEGFHPNICNTPEGAKMIGYGYPCVGNSCDKLRPPITEAQASTLLKNQVKSFEKCVTQNVKCAQLNAEQFSALVSFSFSVGCEVFKASPLVAKLNKNDVSGAAAEFAKWNRVGGKVVPALTKRRKAERTLFSSNEVC